MSRHLLAEWAPQDGVLLTWPHAGSDWSDCLPEAERTYLEIALAVSRYQRVVIVAYDTHHLENLRDKLLRAGIPENRLVLSVAPSNDTWVRDYGPLAVEENGATRLIDFRFNGWGGKYPHALDDAVAEALFRQGLFAPAQWISSPLVLEGGAVETDGRGTLLANLRCLLTATRNANLDQSSLEAQMRELLGLERFLWLDLEPLEGDDTDGHIDTLARFCDPHTIAYLHCDDPADPQFDALREIEVQLKRLQTPDGAPYRLMALPWPQPVYDESGRRLPATYANFLIINQAVLVPVYNDPADERAIATLARCFPDREIIAIDCTVLVRQNGSLHCATLQLPCGTLLPPAAIDKRLAL
ncbi:MAG: agmatine deiminase family protein [Gammaproteobacteria bacterium]